MSQELEPRQGEALEKPDRMRELEGEMAEVAAEIERLSVADSTGSGTELVHIGQSAPQVKRELARRAQNIADLRERGKAIAAAMQEEMERRTREAMEIIDPLKAMVKRLEEGIWTINLYLGRDEQIKTIRDGDPAPADEPVRIRQLVLSMDEETAITEDGGLDFEDVTTFDAWLLRDPSHVEQVIPDRKGVVAIRPRGAPTKERNRGRWESEAEKRDKHTYFLIRNGDRLYRLWTDFSIGDRMVPTRNEFTNLFKTRRYNFGREEDETEILEPGDHGYDEAAAKAEYRERDYTRMGLILQGLAERTPVLHPLPEGGLDFLDGTHPNAELIDFVLDAEQSLATGREPFREWQKRINSELRPGMRIVGAFGGYESAWRRVDELDHEQGRNHGRHSRLHPTNAPVPRSLVIHRLEGRRGRYLTFRYERTDKRWDEWEGEVDYKNRAACDIHPDDPFVIAIDFAEIDVMVEYLQARTERHAYREMFPLLLAAIRTKREEAEREAPFRELLRGAFMAEHGASAEEADSAIPELVWWWKLKNKDHRPLVGEDDAKALREIVAEFGKRLKLDRRATSPELLKRLQADHPKALLIARRPDGFHVVLDPERDDEDVFVRVSVYTKTGKPRPKEERRWSLVPRTASSWRRIYEHPRWKGWRRAASRSEYITGPEIEAVIAQLREENPDAVAISYRAWEEGKDFEVWMVEEVEIPARPTVEFHFREGTWEGTPYGWRRKDGEVQLFKRRWYGGRGYTGRTPWRPEERYSRGRQVLWEDTAAIDRQLAVLDRAKEMSAASGKLRGIVSRVESRLLEQRTEAEEQRLHAEFMEEYGDESLWEGYRKTLKDPKFYPRDLPDTDYLGQLVDEGVELGGKTLAQAAALAGAEKPPAEWADLELRTELEADEAEDFWDD